MTTKPGERLRRYRQAQHMSQDALAAALGVTQGMIHQLEKGIAAPGRALAGRIEEMTGIPMRDW